MTLKKTGGSPVDYRVIQGDVADVLPTLEAESFDAVLSDPPY